DRALELYQDRTVRFIAGSDGDQELTETLTLNIVTAAAHGTIVDFDSVTGMVTYEPTSGYYGSDSFSFTLTDSSGLTSAVATASFVIHRANGTPNATSLGVSTAAGTEVTFTLQGDDGDADLTQPIRYEIVAPPLRGT